MKAAIQVEHLSKRYSTRGSGPSYATLRETISTLAFSLWPANRRRQEERETWALRDVTFDVMPGDVVGIIGMNGAGKTTLLKVLSRVTRPSAGCVRLRGRVASLLEVGTGFHPELTGRENVFLSGAILGMSKAEVRRHFDSIVAFAGLEQSLDIPVKFLSSGMRVRLGFAVAAHLDAEILLTDEVLGLGDAAFQAKSHDLLQELGRCNRTALIVSHNLGVIAELCQRTILLERGAVVADGPTRLVIKEYLLRSCPSPRGEGAIKAPVVNKGIIITRAAVLDAHGVPATEVAYSEDFKVMLEFTVERFIPQLSIGIGTTNDSGITAASSWAVFQQPYSPGQYAAWGQFPGRFLAPGRYRLDVGAEQYKVEVYHYVSGCVSFEIVNTTLQFDGSLPGWGVTFPQLAWVVRSRAISQEDNKADADHQAALSPDQK